MPVWALGSVSTAPITAIGICMMWSIQNWVFRYLKISMIATVMQSDFPPSWGLVAWDHLCFPSLSWTTECRKGLSRRSTLGCRVQRRLTGHLTWLCLRPSQSRLRLLWRALRGCWGLFWGSRHCSWCYSQLAAHLLIPCLLPLIFLSTSWSSFFKSKWCWWVWYTPLLCGQQLETKRLLFDKVVLH